MPLQAEILVDRRRLKRRLSVWRLVAILAVLAAIAALIMSDDKLSAAAGFKPHIARVTITGIIREDREQQELFAKLAKSSQVKAVILKVNSPGGTTTGGEALFEVIRETGEKKPVVAVFGTIATSAAYIVGLASDHIVARGNTITGSVGVILQWAEVSEMLNNLGIKMQEVKSGALKATPSPFRPLDEAGRELTREMVEESEQWFRGLVAERRPVDPDTVPGLSDGRIYSGRQALQHKLIDQIGGEKQAVRWLEEERQIPAGLQIVEWKAEDSGGFGWLGSAARILSALTGISTSGIKAALAPLYSLRSVQLDGLVSLWHPSNN
jgi:protease-4